MLCCEAGSALWLEKNGCLFFYDYSVFLQPNLKTDPKRGSENDPENADTKPLPTVGFGFVSAFSGSFSDPPFGSPFLGFGFSAAVPFSGADVAQPDHRVQSVWGELCSATSACPSRPPQNTGLGPKSSCQRIRPQRSQIRGGTYVEPLREYGLLTEFGPLRRIPRSVAGSSGLKCMSAAPPSLRQQSLGSGALRRAVARTLPRVA